MLFKRKTNFVGSKALNFSIKFISSAMKQSSTVEQLKPYLENILYEIVIPIMLVTHKDVVNFKEDPIEYIRKQDDFTETLYMPKMNVIDLLQYICRHKSGKGKGKKTAKPEFLFPFLVYVSNNLREYAEKIGSG